MSKNHPYVADHCMRCCDRHLHECSLVSGHSCGLGSAPSGRRLTSCLKARSSVLLCGSAPLPMNSTFRFQHRSPCSACGCYHHPTAASFLCGLPGSRRLFFIHRYLLCTDGTSTNLLLTPQPQATVAPGFCAADDLACCRRAPFADCQKASSYHQARIMQ
jgi:hypothetical protein